MTPREIEACITYGPVVHSVPIAPGLTNAPGSPLAERLDEPTAVRGGRTEDKVPHEGQTTFDFYFEAIAPRDGATVGIHVDVEGQAAYADRPYPMEHRAQYYAARLVSSQYGREFTHSHYEKLKRVYSVWLFADGPQELQGTIWSTETTWRLHGRFDDRKTCAAKTVTTLQPRPCDLMTVVFGFMGGETAAKASPSRTDVIALLDVLFEREETNRSKRDILERQFSIAVTPGLEAGSMALDEINEGMARLLERRLSEKWLAEGRTDGREQGLAEGRKEGLAEGQNAALLASIRSLGQTLGLSPTAAMDALEVPKKLRASLMEALEANPDKD